MKSLAQQIALAKHYWPKTWANMDTRVYRGIERWGDYRHPILDWVRNEAQEVDDIFRTLEHHASPAPYRWSESGIPEINDILPSKATYEVMKKHWQHDWPFFFIEPGLLTAAMLSSPSFKIDPLTLRLPYEGFTLVLPSNALGLDCISVGRIDMSGWDDYVTSITGATSSRCIRLDCYFADGRKFIQSLAFPLEPNSGQTVLDQSITNIFLGVLFAMAARPEYVESGRRIGTHKKSRREIWTPNVIGRKYAAKRTDGGESGSHASPRMHWRRGHFRQQPIGPGRAEHKVIWLEPMLIAAPKAMETVNGN